MKVAISESCKKIILLSAEILLNCIKMYFPFLIKLIFYLIVHTKKYKLRCQGEKVLSYNIDSNLIELTTN